MDQLESPGIAVLRRALAVSLMVQLQMQVQLTVPLKGPEHDVSLGVLVYGNYALPPTFNSTLSLPVQPVEIPARRRRNQRQLLYLSVEHLLERTTGVAGRACLLRSICEAAAWPVQHDGLLGELLHVLLTPSSTSDNGLLHPDYTAAEVMGRRGGEVCSKTFPACPSSPLDLMTTLQENWNT